MITVLIFQFQTQRAALLANFVPSSCDLLQRVMKLFRRSDWVYRYDKGISRLGLTFITELLDLKVDQISTIEVDVHYLSDMHCFSHVRRVSDSVLKIIQAVFPTLENKGLKYWMEIDQSSWYKSRTVFYWCFRDSTTPNAELEMNWSVDSQYPHFPRGENSFQRHKFTFSANSVWLVERAEDIKVIDRIRLENFLLPFVMGGHNRLGATSPIKALHSDVLKLIGKIVNGTI